LALLTVLTQANSLGHVRIKKLVIMQQTSSKYLKAV